jgi:hypothetical protein
MMQCASSCRISHGQGEADPGQGGVTAADGGWRSFRDDPATGDHRHPVGQRLSLLHVVRGKQDGGSLAAQVADDLPCIPARVRVEPGGRLVEE